MISRFPRRTTSENWANMQSTKTLDIFIDEVVEFTKYAWMFRYPCDVEGAIYGRSWRRSAQGPGICRDTDDPVGLGVNRPTTTARPKPLSPVGKTPPDRGRLVS